MQKRKMIRSFFKLTNLLTYIIYVYTPIGEPQHMLSEAFQNLMNSPRALTTKICSVHIRPRQKIFISSFCAGCLHAYHNMNETT